MWREKSSTSARRDALPGEARAAAARQDRHAEIARTTATAAATSSALRGKADAERLDRVHARVLRVEVAACRRRSGPRRRRALERGLEPRGSATAASRCRRAHRRPGGRRRAPSPRGGRAPPARRRPDRHARADEPHLDAGERAGEPDVVEVAEVADAEHPPGEPAEARRRATRRSARGSAARTSSASCPSGTRTAVSDAECSRSSSGTSSRPQRAHGAARRLGVARVAGEHVRRGPRLSSRSSASRSP